MGIWVLLRFFGSYIQSLVMCPNLITSIGNEVLSEDEQYYSEDLPALETYEVIPESVGQYTGLQDKNGKEIYEGDILKFKRPYICDLSHRHIGQVIFVSGCFVIEGVKQYKGIREELNSNYEVIGNIHENPNLL